MTRFANFANVALVLASTANAQSHAPSVTDLQVDAETPHRVTLTIAWPNAWRNERNHDAAWLVLRSDDPRTRVLRLAADGHRGLDEDEQGVSLQLASDHCGLFVTPANAHRGNVSWRLAIQLAEPAPANIRAWAIAMVYVPAGGFELGDDDPVALNLGAFHQRGKDDEAAGPYFVADESAIDVAEHAGGLWYRAERPTYRGEQGGPIPAAWPKGTRAFYVMKHELTQGLYAEWLSALPPSWQDARAPLDLEGEETGTCSIKKVGGRFEASAPDRPCNFVSWADTSALLDWLALRPMTEFEFEKAARGPVRPMPGDYPWGTADDEQLARTVTETRDLQNATVVDEARLSDATRHEHGASFYWVMDLAGSVWERVITAGHPAGRTFVGSHGDGTLDRDGTATNPDWPQTTGELAPGVGFRGGAEYFKPRQANNPTNPHSPVALRTFAGWGGALRYKTYSARGCRTAPVGLEIPTTAQKSALAAQLLKRRERDQAVRSRFDGQLAEAERLKISADAGAIDRANTVWMQDVLARYGWPGRSMVGDQAAQAAFLLVQHADPAPTFQAMCLPLLERAVAAKDASPGGFAYLTDRVRVKQQRPQVYGTQYHAAIDENGVRLRTATDGFVYLAPIVEDPGQLDERRRAVGLKPWQDYERGMARLHERDPLTAPRAWNGELPVLAERR